MAGESQRFETRQRMNNKAFEVFHYRDRQFDPVGVHHHDFYEIYYFLKGNVRFRVEGRTYDLVSGDLLLISPRELHELQVESDTTYERIVLWVDRSYLARLSAGRGNLSACFDVSDPNHTNLLRLPRRQTEDLGQLLNKLATETHHEKMGSGIYAQGLLMQFLVEINRQFMQVIPREERPKEPDTVEQVLGYIGEHFRETLTLDSLAGTFFVSKYYLSHAFRERVGISLYRYVQMRRLMYARERMTEGQRPLEVCHESGFGDYANFYRSFKAEYGVSPKEFADKYA